MIRAGEISRNEILPKRQLLNNSGTNDAGLCDRTLKACDKLVKGLQTEIKNREALLDAVEAYQRTQSKEIERLRSKQDSLLNNKWFWFGAGIIAGGLTFGYVTRK